MLTPSVKVSYGDSSKLLSANKDYQFEVYSDEDYQNVATAAEKTNAGTTYVRIQGKMCIRDSHDGRADDYSGSLCIFRWKSGNPAGGSIIDVYYDSKSI